MSLSIRIPIRKYTSIVKTKKKKGEFVKTLINQEKCNLCRLKFFANWFVEKFNIPDINLKEFLKVLNNNEHEYILNPNQNTSFFNVNYQYIFQLNSFFDKKKITNFVNIPIISRHFRMCIYNSLKNQRIQRFNEIDKHIKIGLTPDFMYTRDPDNNNLVFHYKNVKCLELLMKMKDMELNQYIKIKKFN